MDRRTAYTALAFTVVLTVLTLGCTRSAGAPARPGGASADAITVVDGRGKEIALQRPIDRVVTIPMPAAAIFIAIDGSAEKLVGMHPASMAALEEGILATIYPEALDVRTDFIESGFTPSVEEVLTLQPEVVFQWAGRGDDLIAPMENAGIPVIGVEYGDQASLETLMQILGQVAGASDRVERLIAHHHEVQEGIADRGQPIPEEAKPRVLYFLRYAEQKQVAGTGTYNDFYIKLAGGTNVAAGGPTGFYEVNAEQILAWDPEVILLGGFDDATPADVYTNEVLSSVNAVEQRRVYKVPLGGYRWDPPSHESPLMWKWLANLLHPDTFSYDLRADVREFYNWVYGYELSDAELDSILRMPLNGDAAGYGQFVAK